MTQFCSTITMSNREAVACNNLTVTRGSKQILAIDSVMLSANTSTAIVGLNGAGKSTFLKVLSGSISDYQGDCSLSNISNRTISPLERARLVAVMPQKLEVTFDISVMQFMHLSLYSQSRRGVWSPTISPLVDKTLHHCGATHLGNRMVAELSGGELKRILLAAALVQSAPLVLLDEPLAGLDPRATEEVTLLIEQLKNESGRTLLTVTHDLVTLPRIADQIIALREGALCWQGSPLEFLTKEALSLVYGGAVPLSLSL
jgi:ABC-type cobalamin/Fe3+-siderophores transport system ATPase subunit